MIVFWLRVTFTNAWLPGWNASCLAAYTRWTFLNPAALKELLLHSYPPSSIVACTGTVISGLAVHTTNHPPPHLTSAVGRMHCICNYIWQHIVKASSPPCLQPFLSSPLNMPETSPPLRLYSFPSCSLSLSWPQSFFTYTHTTHAHQPSVSLLHLIAVLFPCPNFTFHRIKGPSLQCSCSINACFRCCPHCTNAYLCDLHYCSYAPLQIQSIQQTSTHLLASS